VAKRWSLKQLRWCHGGGGGEEVLEVSMLSLRRGSSSIPARVWLIEESWLMW
jgi:hypothetical protein